MLAVCRDRVTGRSPLLRPSMQGLNLGKKTEKGFLPGLSARALQDGFHRTGIYDIDIYLSGNAKRRQIPEYTGRTWMLGKDV